MAVEKTYGTTNSGNVRPGESIVESDKHDANRDPISGAPGAHPIGTGIGAGAAGAAGAAIGSALGPAGSIVGGVVGAVVGAVAGGLAGKGAAEAVNPTEEDAYWKENYKTRPYYTPGSTYEDYAPAYQYGYTARSKYANRRYDEVESDLRRDWESDARYKGHSWDRAKHAVRDAYHRTSDAVERAVPGDSDRDGK
jgi:hypothetical protein